MTKDWFSYEKEDAAEDPWRGQYNGESCEQCGRDRVLRCKNGKRVCEKCCWCPEDEEYIDQIRE